MVQSYPFLILPADSQTAVSQAAQALQANGYSVLPSFDLRVARAAHRYCACPYHGTGQCDCQLVVMLVYDQAEAPVSLVAHTSNGETLFEFVDSPQQPADPGLLHRVQTALSFLRDNFMGPDSTNNLRVP